MNCKREFFLFCLIILICCQGRDRAIKQPSIRAEPRAVAQETIGQLNDKEGLERIQQVSDDVLEKRYQQYGKAQDQKPNAIGQMFIQLWKWGDMCSDCKNFKYFAFKAGTSSTTVNKYLTAPASCSGTLSFVSTSDPGTNQLFIGTRLLDKSWLLQPASCLGSYMRAQWPSSIVLSPFKTWQSRFWFERHSDHTHIESAGYVGSWWTGSATLSYMNGGASSYIIEHWPDRPWP